MRLLLISLKSVCSTKTKKKRRRRGRRSVNQISFQYWIKRTTLDTQACILVLIFCLFNISPSNLCVSTLRTRNAHIHVLNLIESEPPALLQCNNVSHSIGYGTPNCNITGHKLQLASMRIQFSVQSVYRVRPINVQAWLHSRYIETFLYVYNIPGCLLFGARLQASRLM